MLKDLLEIDLVKLGCYFNENTCQVAYHKSGMKPTDHGYIKGMEGYFDLENNMCICRSFDNALVPLMKKYNFKSIVNDDLPASDFHSEYHIRISEVRRVLNLAQRPDKLAKLSGKIYIKESKGKKDKIVVEVDKLENKKQLLMKELLKTVKQLKNSEDDLAGSVFEIASLVRKNLFTKEEFEEFLKNS